MKVRTSFVSNSSSSSFVIFVKGELTEKNFMDSLNVKNTIFYKPMSGLFEYLEDTCPEYTNFVSDLESFKSFAADMDIYGRDNEYKKYEEMLNNGYSFLSFFLSYNENFKEIVYHGLLTAISSYSDVCSVKGGQDVIVVAEDL